jgi:hypothetical protein
MCVLLHDKSILNAFKEKDKLGRPFFLHLIFLFKLILEQKAKLLVAAIALKYHFGL